MVCTNPVLVLSVDAWRERGVLVYGGSWRRRAQPRELAGKRVSLKLDVCIHLYYNYNET